ncbi:MAG: hypothetical protein ACC663_01630 [Gammaproteobacteria bacterium]
MRYIKGGPIVESGYVVASDKPGLGVSPRMEMLGEPVVIFELLN